MSDYCSTHDRSYPSLSQCPVCRAEEVAELHRTMAAQQAEALEQEEKRHEERVRLQKKAIYKRANPGDYKCPKCLFITLNRDAGSCPVCHASIPDSYWPPIHEAERRRAEERLREQQTAAEKWAREAPERERQAKAAADRVRRKRRLTALPWLAYWGICLLSAAYVVADDRSGNGRALLATLVEARGITDPVLWWVVRLAVVGAGILFGPGILLVLLVGLALLAAVLAVAYGVQAAVWLAGLSLWGSIVVAVALGAALLALAVNVRNALSRLKAETIFSRFATGTVAVVAVVVVVSVGAYLGSRTGIRDIEPTRSNLEAEETGLPPTPSGAQEPVQVDGVAKAEAEATAPPLSSAAAQEPVRVDGVAKAETEETVPPLSPSAPQEPVRVDGKGIKPPVKTKDVRPEYPQSAQSARLQGVVIIEATIGPNGAVQDARVLRSIPLLDDAALDAVKQWEFTPTLRDGVPVPVIMTVTVQFTLS